MSTQNPSSIKELIQSLIPESTAMVMGVVTASNPIKIQVLSNLKMVAQGNILIVPKHLTNYTTTADISLGALDGLTSMESHAHEDGSHGGHTEGNGGHSHNDGTHRHALHQLSVTGATITIHNALQIGEKVWMLRFDSGKQYYVLDRVVGA